MADFWCHIFLFLPTLVSVWRTSSFTRFSLYLITVHAISVYTLNLQSLHLGRLTENTVWSVIGQGIRKHPFRALNVNSCPDPNTTSSSLRHLSQCFSFKNPLQGCVLPTTLTMVGAWPLTLLYVQAVARRLRAGRVGFEARRTMASQSESYDAVVIGGGVFVHPDTFVWK